MSHRRTLRSLLALAMGILVLPALATSKDAAPGKSLRVAILPFVNASPEIGATKMMDDIVREQVKKVDKSRAIFLPPADVERILTDRNKLESVYRITDKWGSTSTLDSTAIGGLDSLLQVDVTSSNDATDPALRKLRVVVGNGGMARMCDPNLAQPDPRAC